MMRLQSAFKSNSNFRKFTLYSLEDELAQIAVQEETPCEKHLCHTLVMSNAWSHRFASARAKIAYHDVIPFIVCRIFDSTVEQRFTQLPDLLEDTFYDAIHGTFAMVSILTLILQGQKTDLSSLTVTPCSLKIGSKMSSRSRSFMMSNERLAYVRALRLA